MRYLCLIHLDEQKLDALPHAERNALNAAHLDYHDELRKRGHLLLAEALDPPRTASCVGAERRRHPDRRDGIGPVG